MTSDELLDRVSAIALAMPETAVKLSHGSPAFSVAGKMFAYFTDNHHNDGRTAIQVKTTGLDEQAMLIEMDPDLYYRPPYIGPSGWVGLRLDQGEPDWEQVEYRLARSWELVAPRRLQQMAEL